MRSPQRVFSLLVRVSKLEVSRNMCRPNADT